MKKTLLLTLALLLSVTTFAQKRGTLLKENFDGNALPSGWVVKGGGTNNWRIKNSEKAGGEANELELYWDPAFIGTTRMVMGSLDLTDIPSIVVSFKHYLDFFDDSCTIGIATSSDNGTTWNSGWEETYTASGRHVINEIITTDDNGKADVLICLYYAGDTYDLNSWFFDDMLIFAQEETDAEVSYINVNNNLGNGYNTVAFTVKNLGTADIKSFEAKYQIEGSDEIVTETFETDLQSFESEIFTFEKPVFLTLGEYQLNVDVTSVNETDDESTSNNSNEKQLTVGMGVAQKIPMIEHFSSSTCHPCVFTNKDMDSLTLKNEGKFTYTKYPMNGPGVGDPYYFADCGTRRSYYNVNSVPMLFLDGKKSDDPMPQENLDKSYNSPSFFDIKGSFKIDGDKINVIVDIMSYINAKGLSVYVTVNEKTTTGNIGSNGETEFHHILMKILQSSSGIKLNMEAGKQQRLELTHNMSTTNVEDMNDLEVAIWIQNASTKEIYNSRFAYAYCEHADPVMNVKANINAEQKLAVSWNEPAINTPTGYNIIIDSKLAAENINALSFTDESQTLDVYDGNIHFIEVVAVYENGMTSLGTITSINDSESVEEMTANSLNIYPNPANDVLKIETEYEINEIAIYDIYGRRQVAVTPSRQIDVADLTSGVYFIKINTEKGNIVKRFIKL